MGIGQWVKRGVRRLLVGQAEGDRANSRLRVISDFLPNLITNNAKAINGGGAAALVLWVSENFGWDISSWEIWIGLAIAVVGAVWRTPNHRTE